MDRRFDPRQWEAKYQRAVRVQRLWVVPAVGPYMAGVVVELVPPGWLTVVETTFDPRWLRRIG